MSVDMKKIIDLAGAIPFDNINDAKVIIENFCSNDMAVITTNKATNVSHGTHCHNSYEFVICYSTITSNIVDNKMYDRSANSLFASNPMQEHGLAAGIKGFSLCGIHIDKKLLQSVANSIYSSPKIVFSNDSFTVNHDLSMLLCLFLEELRYKQPGQEFILENLSMLIAANLIRQIKHNLQPKPHNLRKNSKENIKKVIDYMNENFTTDISCSDLSKLINMDKFSFIRSFKSQTSKTPYEYLLDLKIEKAKKMLKSDKYTITEISMMCGFSSHSHFTTTFKKKIGVSPKEYKLSL
jgi:AraC family transcriptional regulator